jgi:hypothetical protein
MHISDSLCLNTLRLIADTCAKSGRAGGTGNWDPLAVKSVAPAFIDADDLLASPRKDCSLD